MLLLVPHPCPFPAPRLAAASLSLHLSTGFSLAPFCPLPPSVLPTFPDTPLPILKCTIGHDMATGEAGGGYSIKEGPR